MGQLRGYFGGLNGYLRHGFASLSLDEFDGAAYKNTRMKKRTKFEGFGAKTGVFGPKMGGNRAVPVTDWLTMLFCILFIILDLQDFKRRKTDNNR
jgi:hypothetical protein